jgi:hypothetical protein
MKKGKPADKDFPARPALVDTAPGDDYIKVTKTVGLFIISSAY